MRTLPLSEVKARLSELVDEVEGHDERIVITRRGRPTAVLVSHDDFDSLQETREVTSDRALLMEIRRGMRQKPFGSFPVPSFTRPWRSISRSDSASGGEDAGGLSRAITRPRSVIKTSSPAFTRRKNSLSDALSLDTVVTVISAGLRERRSRSRCARRQIVRRVDPRGSG